MEGKQAHPLAGWKHQGVKKSVSNASAKTTRSHDSIRTTGAHPLESLRVHQIEDASQLRQVVSADEDDEEMPPLVSLKDEESGKLSHAGVLTKSTGGGDMLRILGLPEVFTVGIDATAFTAKNLQGIKGIPPGPHFFWAAHPSGMSTRSGTWFISTGTNQVHVIQWDDFHEVLCEPTRTEARIQAESVDDTYASMLSYDDPTAMNEAAGQMAVAQMEANSSIWSQLTGDITPLVLNRITKESRDYWFMQTTDRVEGSFLISAETELDKSMSNAWQRSRELNFTFSQRSKTYSMEHTGSERTLEARDATGFMLSVLEGHKDDTDDNDVIGEFQFAFAVGVHLGNDACVLQWWHMLLKLILRAYYLPIRRPNLAASLMRAIVAQIEYDATWLETSIFDDNPTLKKDLRLALIVYKSRMDELLANFSPSSDFLQAASAFKHLEATVSAPPLSWDLRGDSYLRHGKLTLEDGEEIDVETSELQDEDERGEYAPEIVELDESGKEKGLVSWKD